MRDPTQDPHKPMGELPANAELRVLVERIVEVADGREEAAGVLARKIFARLYEVSGSLCAPQASHCTAELAAILIGIHKLGASRSVRACPRSPAPCAARGLAHIIRDIVI